METHGKDIRRKAADNYIAWFRYASFYNRSALRRFQSLLQMNVYISRNVLQQGDFPNNNSLSKLMQS